MTRPQHTWHADETALAGFVDGSVDPVLGASVETHLMTCPRCRTRVAELTPRELLDGVWTGVRQAVEAPVPSLVERLLGLLGVSVETCRLLGAVPAMRGAWLLGILGATLFSGLAATASPGFGLAVFLLVAPMAPLAAVAASFGGDADPCRELVGTAPYPAFRLLLLRTAAVVAASVPVAVVVGLLIPGPAWIAIAWLTPAAAGVTLTLALAPTVGTSAAAALLATLWSAAVLGAFRLHDLLTVVAPAMQVLFLCLAVAGATSVALRYRSNGFTGSHS